MQECKVCNRTDCQIGWHRYAESTSKAGKTKKSQGQNPSGMVRADEGAQKPREITGGPEKRISRVLPGMVRETKQRWSRDKYNAYQRDLMRKRRALKRKEVLGDGVRSVEVKSG